MIDTAIYIVERDVARRSGLLESRYRTADGRFVLNRRDLARVRLTADEFITGLSGVEKVSAEEARTLIAQGGFRMGDATLPTDGKESEVGL